MIDLSVRAVYRRKHGTAPEHRMIRDMEKHGDLPVGKHAIGTIHKRWRQWRRVLNREETAMRARQVNAILNAKPSTRAQMDAKAPLFKRAKDAFARMLRRRA